MPRSLEMKNLSYNILTIIAGIVVTGDTIIGVLVSLGLDLQKPNELLMSITFVLGLPIYFIDLRYSKRIVFGLWILFTVRWIVRCFGGNSPNVCNPVVWPVGILLFVAAALLQVSKLKRDKQHKLFNSSAKYK